MILFVICSQISNMSCKAMITSRWIITLGQFRSTTDTQFYCLLQLRAFLKAQKLFETQIFSKIETVEVSYCLDTNLKSIYGDCLLFIALIFIDSAKLYYCSTLLLTSFLVWKNQFILFNFVIFVSNYVFYRASNILMRFFKKQMILSFRVEIWESIYHQKRSVEPMISK